MVLPTWYSKAEVDALFENEPSQLSMGSAPLADLNSAPLGYSIAQDSALNRPSSVPAGVSVIVLNIPYAGFNAPYVFQTATREDTGQVFARLQYNGVWTAWEQPGLTPLGSGGPLFDVNNYLSMAGKGIYGLADPSSDSDAATKHYVDGKFSRVPSVADWDNVTDGIHLLDGSMPNMVGAPLPGVQMDGFITTVTYGLPNQTVAEWRFQTAMGLPWDGSPVRFLARSKFNNVWSAWDEVGGGTKSVALTQAEYDALATKDPNTLYLITS